MYQACMHAHFETFWDPAFWPRTAPGAFMWLALHETDVSVPNMDNCANASRFARQFLRVYVHSEAKWLLCWGPAPDLFSSGRLLMMKCSFYNLNNTTVQVQYHNTLCSWFCKIFSIRLALAKEKLFWESKSHYSKECQIIAIISCGY